MWYHDCNYIVQEFYSWCQNLLGNDSIRIVSIIDGQKSD